MTPGQALAQQVIDGLDQLARWDPESWGDVFGTLASLPDVLAAAAEAVSSVAATAEECRVAKTEITSAAAEASLWAGNAAGELGQFYGQYPFLRSRGPRWIPPGR